MQLIKEHFLPFLPDIHSFHIVCEPRRASSAGQAYHAFLPWGLSTPLFVIFPSDVWSVLLPSISSFAALQFTFVCLLRHRLLSALLNQLECLLRLTRTNPTFSPPALRGSSF